MPGILHAEMVRLPSKTSVNATSGGLRAMRLRALRHGDQVLWRRLRSDVRFVLSETIVPCGTGVGYERQTRAGPRREAIPPTPGQEGKQQAGSQRGRAGRRQD